MSDRRPLVFVAATLFALWFHDLHAPMHLDTARDLLIAKNCVEGTFCAGAGPTTSFGGLVQGALWSHALEARERFGVSIASFEWIVRVILAVAAGLVAVTVRVGFGRKATMMTWLAWIALTNAAIEYPILWNPTLSPLPIAGFHLALAIGARTGKTGPFVIAAMLLALAVDLHVAYAIMVPFLLVAIAALARRPLLALLYSGVLMVQLVALDSPGAFRHDLARLSPFAILLVEALAVAVAVGFGLRSVVRKRPSAHRPWYVAAASSAYFAAAVLVLARVGHHEIEWRYLGPVVPPLAILFGAALERIVPVLAVPIAEVVAVALVLLHRPMRANELYLRDAEPIARALYARASFDDLFVHLRGPQAFPLLGVIAGFEPPGRPHGLDEDVLVMAGGKGIDLGGGRTASIVWFRPRIEGRTMEVCRASECHTITVDPTDLNGRRSFGWEARAYPGLGEMARLFGFGGGRMTYRLHVTPGPPKTVVASSQSCRNWRIELPTGPTRAVTLDGDAGEIVFSVDGCRDDGWLPAFTELPDDVSESLLP